MTNSFTFHSPIYEEAASLGATFASRAGWTLPKHFDSLEGELLAARQDVVLIDSSATGKYLLEGKRIGDLLGSLWSIPALRPGQGAVAGPVGVFQLRPDQAYLVAAPVKAVDIGETMRAAAAAQASEAGFVTVTDLTHAQSELWLIGPRSRELLSRLCGLDFHPSQFPDLAVRASSVAKTRQVMRRQDVGKLPAFALLGGRSFGAYLWRTLLRAGADLGIQPAGLASLDALRTDR